MRHLIVVAMLAAPALLPAQTPATVSPGMNQVQVVAALGAPANSRSKDEYTYLYYPNGCLRECGMNDLVVLRRDSVVDAIFRSPSRHYTGTSSSPQEVSPVAAKRGSKPLAIAKPAAPVKAEPTPAAAPAVAEPKPAVAAATDSAVVVPGTKTDVIVPGTKTEIIVPGTKTEVTTPVSRMTPPPANDTRPSIPLSPPPTAP